MAQRRSQRSKANANQGEKHINNPKASANRGEKHTTSPKAHINRGEKRPTSPPPRKPRRRSRRNKKSSPEPSICPESPGEKTPKHRHLSPPTPILKAPSALTPPPRTALEWIWQVFVDALGYWYWDRPEVREGKHVVFIGIEVGVEE